MRNRVGKIVLVIPLSVFAQVQEKWIERDEHGRVIGRWVKVILDKPSVCRRHVDVWNNTLPADRKGSPPGPTVTHDIAMSNLCFKCPNRACGRHNHARAAAAVALVTELHDV